MDRHVHLKHVCHMETLTTLFQSLKWYQRRPSGTYCSTNTVTVTVSESLIRLWMSSLIRSQLSLLINGIPCRSRGGSQHIVRWDICSGPLTIRLMTAHTLSHSVRWMWVLIGPPLQNVIYSDWFTDTEFPYFTIFNWIFCIFLFVQ